MVNSVGNANLRSLGLIANKERRLLESRTTGDLGAGESCSLTVWCIFYVSI
jgi:hypothetical protein